MKPRLGLTVVVALIVACLVWCVVPTSPRATWTASPEVEVLELDTSQIDRSSWEIPFVQIWGDGRVIWSWHDEEGRRHVLEGRLSQEELGSVVQRVVDSGLLRRSVFDQLNGEEGYPSLRLKVELGEDRLWYQFDEERLSAEQSELIEFLRGGAGADGHPFTPAEGVLQVYPIEAREETNAEIVHRWPDREFGYVESFYQELLNSNRCVLCASVV